MVVTATRVTGTAKITYVIDDVVPIKPGAGCAYASASDHTKVSCTVTTLDSQDPYPTLQLTLGNGNDMLAYHNRTDQTYNFASVDLGAGDDKATDDGSVDGNYIAGGTGNDTLTLGKYSVGWGDDGNDTLKAAAGTIAQGGNGNDTITTTGDAADGGAKERRHHRWRGRPEPDRRRRERQDPRRRRERLHLRRHGQRHPVG